jgi:hypothetical protein
MVLTSELQALVAAGIGFLITAGLKSLGDAVGIELSSLASGLTATVVTAVVFFSNGLLAMVPVDSQPIVSALMLLIVAVFGAFGIHGTLKSLRSVKK